MVEPKRKYPPRIRLTHDSSVLLRSLLLASLGPQWEVRAEDIGGETHNHNRRIRLTKKLLDEVERTMEEAGWLDRELTIQ